MNGPDCLGKGLPRVDRVRVEVLYPPMRIGIDVRECPCLLHSSTHTIEELPVTAWIASNGSAFAAGFAHAVLLPPADTVKHKLVIKHLIGLNPDFVREVLRYLIEFCRERQINLLETKVATSTVPRARRLQAILGWLSPQHRHILEHLGFGRVARTDYFIQRVQHVPKEGRPRLVVKHANSTILLRPLGTRFYYEALPDLAAGQVPLIGLPARRLDILIPVKEPIAVAPSETTFDTYQLDLGLEK